MLPSSNRIGTLTIRARLGTFSRSAMFGSSFIVVAASLSCSTAFRYKSLESHRWELREPSEWSTVVFPEAFEDVFDDMVLSFAREYGNMFNKSRPMKQSSAAKAVKS